MRHAAAFPLSVDFYSANYLLVGNVDWRFNCSVIELLLLWGEIIKCEGNYSCGFSTGWNSQIINTFIDKCSIDWLNWLIISKQILLITHGKFKKGTAAFVTCFGTSRVVACVWHVTVMHNLKEARLLGTSSYPIVKEEVKRSICGVTWNTRGKSSPHLRPTASHLGGYLRARSHSALALFTLKPDLIARHWHLLTGWGSSLFFFDPMCSFAELLKRIMLSSLTTICSWVSCSSVTSAFVCLCEGRNRKSGAVEQNIQ